MRHLIFVFILLVISVALLSCNQPPEEETSTDMPIAKPEPVETTEAELPPPVNTTTSPDGKEVKTTVEDPNASNTTTIYKDPLPAGFGDYEEINIKVDPPVNVYDFEAVDVNGNTVKLVDFRGSWVYIDFWATWCGPCMAELPNVASLQTKIPELMVLGISLDDKGSETKVKEVMAKNNMTIPQIINADQAESIADKYSVSPIPFSVLINPEGKIVMKAVRGEEMFDVIKEAMKG